MKIKLLLTILTVICFAAMASAQEDFRSDYAKFQANLKNAKTPKEQLALLEALVFKYPDERRATSLVWRAALIYINELKNPDAAIAFAKKAIEKASKEETIKEYKANLFSILGMAEKRDEIRKLAKETLQKGEQDWRTHSSIAGAAFKAEDWEFALEHYEFVINKATLEYFASQPGYQKERAQAYINWLQGKTYTNMAIALEKLNRISESLQAFENAYSNSNRNFLGFTNNDYVIPWGKALVKSGRYEDALKRLGPEAILADSEKAMEVFTQAFHALKGKDADLDNFIAQKKSELKKPAPDFTAFDYDKNPVKLSDYKGKVVLLNFWFPT